MTSLPAHVRSVALPSRPKEPSVFGKSIDSIKVSVPESVKYDLQVEAQRLGMTVSEFIRRSLEIRLYGEFHVSHLAALRVAAVAGNMVRK